MAELIYLLLLLLLGVAGRSWMKAFSPRKNLSAVIIIIISVLRNLLQRAPVVKAALDLPTEARELRKR